MLPLSSPYQADQPPNSTCQQDRSAAEPTRAAIENRHVGHDVHQALLPKPDVRSLHPLSPWKRRYTVLLVAAIAALLSADQNLLAPNLSAAADFFGLDDHQKDTYLGGYLMAAFFLVGAPAALLCGYFADRYNRVHMLAFIVVVGEAPCLGTYWVTHLWHFFVVRMLTGIAIGGCFPLVFSLLGDLFPVSQRAAMSAIVQIAVGGGIGGGQMVAGLLGPSTNWRLPFVVMASPTMLLSLVLLLTVQEPPRGGFEEALEMQLAAGAAYSESITWRKVWRLIKVSSNWIIIMQGLFGCLPWGVIQTYINDYLHQQKGLTVELATTVILLFGVGCSVGVIAGGAAGQALYNWRRWTMAVLTGGSVLAGAVPILYLINADIKAIGMGPTLLVSALAGVLSSIAGPNLRAIMINVNAPETRGVALALQSVTDDLGKGLGPVVVAAFISRLGRTGAFNLSVCAWIPCGIMLTSLACTMGRDEDDMQDHLAEQSARTLQQIHVEFPPGSSPDDPGAARPGASPSASESGPQVPTHSSGPAFGGSIARVLRRTLTRGGRGGATSHGGAKVEGAQCDGHQGLGLRQSLRGGPAVAAASPTSSYLDLTGPEGYGVVCDVLVATDAAAAELQRLLPAAQGAAPCVDTQQQRCLPKLAHRQQHNRPRGTAEAVCVQEGDRVEPAGHPEQAQVCQVELQLHSPSSAYSEGSIKDSSFSLRRSRSQECMAPAALAVSAASTRHRSGHGPKLCEGRYSSRSSSSSGACSMALGEGVEDGRVPGAWLHRSVVRTLAKQGLVV